MLIAYLHTAHRPIQEKVKKVALRLNQAFSQIVRSVPRTNNGRLHFQAERQNHENEKDCLQDATW